MKQFRITKYNPKYRDALGVYTKKEWTSYSDIGKNVTKEEYETIETAYIETAIGFLKEQEIVELRVVGLEDHGKNIEAGFLSEGAIVKMDSLAPVLRGILREKYWAKLETKNAFIHFGWDYLLHVYRGSRCAETGFRIRRNERLICRGV